MVAKLIAAWLLIELVTYLVAARTRGWDWPIVALKRLAILKGVRL